MWIYNLGNNFSNFHFQFFSSHFKEVITFPWSKICLWTEEKEKCSVVFGGFFWNTRTSFLFYAFFIEEIKAENKRGCIFHCLGLFLSSGTMPRGLDSISFRTETVDSSRVIKGSEKKTWKSCSQSKWKWEQMAILFVRVELPGVFIHFCLVVTFLPVRVPTDTATQSGQGRRRWISIEL